MVSPFKVLKYRVTDDTNMILGFQLFLCEVSSLTLCDIFLSYVPVKASSKWPPPKKKKKKRNYQNFIVEISKCKINIASNYRAME